MILSSSSRASVPNGFSAAVPPKVATGDASSPVEAGGGPLMAAPSTGGGNSSAGGQSFGCSSEWLELSLRFC